MERIDLLFDPGILDVKLINQLVAGMRHEHKTYEHHTEDNRQSKQTI